MNTLFPKWTALSPDLTASINKRLVSSMMIPPSMLYGLNSLARGPTVLPPVLCGELSELSSFRFSVGSLLPPLLCVQVRCLY